VYQALQGAPSAGEWPQETSAARSIAWGRKSDRFRRETAAIAASTPRLSRPRGGGEYGGRQADRLGKRRCRWVVAHARAGPIGSVVVLGPTGLVALHGSTRPALTSALLSRLCFRWSTEMRLLRTLLAWRQEGEIV